jgi:hypothetical protein
MVETRRQPDHLAAVAGQTLVGAFEVEQAFDPDGWWRPGCPPHATCRISSGSPPPRSE